MEREEDDERVQVPRLIWLLGQGKSGGGSTGAFGMTSLALTLALMVIDVMSGALCVFEGVINMTVVCRKVSKRTVIKVTLKHRGAAEQA